MMQTTVYVVLCLHAAEPRSVQDRVLGCCTSFGSRFCCPGSKTRQTCPLLGLSLLLDLGSDPSSNAAGELIAPLTNKVEATLNLSDLLWCVFL